MDYQEELREIASKRSKRDFRNKMIMLILFLLIVLLAMNYLGKSDSLLGVKINQKSIESTQEQVLPQADETE